MTPGWSDTSHEMLRQIEHRPLQILEVDLAGLAHGVAAGFGASHRIEVDIPEGTVAADRDLVVEILTDLLDHALEGAPEGSSVTICADSEKLGLRLWVTNRDRGTDPARRAAPIRSYRPVDRSATRPYGGPGVGLHLAPVRA